MKSVNTKSILTAFLFTLCLQLHSQTYYAGQNLSVYVDIHPDTLINYYCSSSSGSSNESFYFDINGDLQNDFQIRAHCDIAGAASNYLITVASLNHSSSVRYGRSDSVYNSYMHWWWVDKVAQPLLAGDSINSFAAKWDSTALYLTDNSYITGGFHAVNDWKGTSDKYIGIKYQNTTDTIYGWIRVQCPGSSGCYIKDYSFDRRTALSIKESESGPVRMYPNPATDKLYIERTNADLLGVELFDMLGKQLSQTIQSTSPKTEVDLNGLQEGIYFLRLKTAEGVSMRKVIVERAK